MKRKFHVRFGKRDEGNNRGQPLHCALVPTSPDPTPSPEDAAMTREIVKVGQLMDIDVADHIVVSQGGRFVSLRERGLGF